MHAMVLWTALAVTQVVEATTPEDTARLYMEAARAEGLGETGRFFDPEALDELKSAFLLLLELEGADGQSEVRRLMFGPGATLDDARAIGPEEFYRGIMNFLESQMQGQNMFFTNSEVLGTVYEGDDVAHVLARVGLGIGGAGTTSLDVLSMRNDGQRWVLLIGEELQQFTSLVRQQVDRAREDSARPLLPR